LSHIASGLVVHGDVSFLCAWSYFQLADLSRIRAMSCLFSTTTLDTAPPFMFA